MQRIATATKAVDLFGAGKHGFRDGNLALGIVPTDLNAELFNSVQEEICAIVEAAGIALDAGTRNQMLLALRAAGVFTTPAQFDDTTKAATTAFVRRHGIQSSGVAAVTVSTVHTVAQAGGTVLVNAAGATTQTLPAASALQTGSRIKFFNVNTGVATVTRAGADVISVNNTAVNSLTLGAGDTLELEADSAGVWRAVSGSAQLGSAAVFLNSLNSSGYQKLPTGLIVQWGVFTANAVAGNPTAVTFPIAFPSAARSAVLIGDGTVTAQITLWTDSLVASGFNARCNTASQPNCRYIALGH